MSTFEKRAREDKLAQRARAKQQRRADKRGMPASAPQIVSAADIVGNVRSIEEVMRTLEGGTHAMTATHAAAVAELIGEMAGRCFAT